MADKFTLREVMTEFNVAIDTIVEFLKSKDIEIGRATPRTKISKEVKELLDDEFQSDKKVNAKSTSIKAEQDKAKKELQQKQEELQKKKHEQEVISGRVKLSGPKVVGKVEELSDKKTTAETDKAVKVEKAEITTPKVETEKPIEEKPVVTIQKEESKKPDETREEEKKPVKKTAKAKQIQTELSDEQKPIETIKDVEQKSIEPKEHKTEYKKLKGVTTTGEKIDGYGKGEGMKVSCIVTVL